MNSLLKLLVVVELDLVDDFSTPEIDTVGRTDL
jgi:hypothetical protein